MICRIKARNDADLSAYGINPAGGSFPLGDNFHHNFVGQADDGLTPEMNGTMPDTDLVRTIRLCHICHAIPDYKNAYKVFSTDRYGLILFQGVGAIDFIINPHLDIRPVPAAHPDKEQGKKGQDQESQNQKQICFSKEGSAFVIS